MGNHEYCVDCGESDFHYHRPCDPVKVAARLKAKAEAEARTKLEVERMQKALNKLGIEYRVNEYGNAEIHHHEFSDGLIAWRKERKLVKKACGKVWWAECGWDDIIEKTCARQIGHSGSCKSHSGTELDSLYKKKK